MKIPRQAQMATVGSQAVGGPRGVQGQDQGHCKGQGQKWSKGQNFGEKIKCLELLETHEYPIKFSTNFSPMQVSITFTGDLVKNGHIILLGYFYSSRGIFILAWAQARMEMPRPE